MEIDLDTTNDKTPCVIVDQGASVIDLTKAKEQEDLLNSLCEGKNNDSIQTVSSS